MRIRGWHYYIVFNCVLIIPCIFGKPVSLNEIIAAENKKTQISELTRKSKLKGGKTVSLNELIATENRKRHASYPTPEQKIKDISEDHLSSNEAPRKKLIKYKRNQVKRISQLSLFKDRSSDINNVLSLLKPQELLNKLRQRNKSKSSKREIIHNEDIGDNSISLFRNLNHFFDKVFHNDAGTANKFRAGKIRHNKIITERDGMVCTCQQKPGLKRSALRIKSPKKTTAHAKTISSEVSADTEAAAATAPDPALANVRSFGSHKNLPVLLSRNPISSRRNHNGHSERGSSAFHGDLKRNITRNNGNSQHNSRIREDASNTESYEESPHSIARNSSSSDGFGRRDRNSTRNKTDEVFKIAESKDGNYRSSKEFNGKVTIEVGRNETGSEISLSKHVGGLRGHVPEDQIGANAEPIQSKEDHEKSNNYVALDRANDQRISDRSGPITTEAEEFSTENITVISIQDLSNLTLALQSAPKGNLPVVTIFGGYSVAKDINGQNKLSEQSIHIYS
ncbi:uncharacterized protein LOC128671504 [Plodia interpunctella]|uniref:uncharacterized protein LOC128671504 n=1 Tax=Plodia interpunctella TaxID=58824 RepID=UPI00236875FE|nr:uncharacterized protein LOC128671504 [Plodia interpunctella]